MLIMSNFSIAHSVFKRLTLQTCKNQGLFGRRLKRILMYMYLQTVSLQVNLRNLRRFTWVDTLCYVILLHVQGPVYTLILSYVCCLLFHKFWTNLKYFYLFMGGRSLKQLPTWLKGTAAYLTLQKLIYKNHFATKKRYFVCMFFFTNPFQWTG